MGTYSRNVTTKISGAISIASAFSSLGGPNQTANLYNAPANSHAIVQLHVRLVTGSATSFSLNVDAMEVAGNNVGQYKNPIYIGPGQTLSLNVAGLSGGLAANITGVEYQNTP
jgi:hypothetical protein